MTLSSTRSTAPFRYAVHPHVKAISGDIILANCSGSYLQCVTPTTIKAGYNFPVNSMGGLGQTIAIVDPFGSPTIIDDLNTFDSKYFTSSPVSKDSSEGASCPSPTATSDHYPRFTVYYPGGKPTFNPGDATQVGFAEETSLDVEWAHVAAPNANILLVVSANDQGQTVQSAQAAAIACNANGVNISALSLSFGTPESTINGGANNTQLQQSEANYQMANRAGITVIASVGDLGATDGGTSSSAPPNPEYPASSPQVLAVGGTNLILKRNTNYNNESVWNDTNNCLSPCSDSGPLGSPTGPGATGGAPSTIFTEATVPMFKTTHPTEYATWAKYQNNKTPVARWTSDVAYNASPNTGVVVYISFLQKYGLSAATSFAIGGTSQGPPQWAGIIATAKGNGAHFGFVNEDLYNFFNRDAASGTKTPSFHDVISGNNLFGSSALGYPAMAGWDPPTGLGSADVGTLLGPLSGIQHNY